MNAQIGPVQRGRSKEWRDGILKVCSKCEAGSFGYAVKQGELKERRSRRLVERNVLKLSLVEAVSSGPHCKFQALESLPRRQY